MPGEDIAACKTTLTRPALRAAKGHRTIIRSRSVDIAVIGPPSDIGANEQAEEISTTAIKTGKRSLKGIVARRKPAILTVRGTAMASLRRFEDAKHDEVAELVELLRETQVIQQHASKYRRIREYSNGLVGHCEEVLRWLPPGHERDELSRTLDVLKSDLEQH